MRFKSMTDYQERFPKEAKWVLENSNTSSLAARMLDAIKNGGDLTPRQRKALRSASEGGTTPAGMPRVYDKVKNVQVRVFQVFDHEERGLRITFRDEKNGWAGRANYEDIVRGRMKLRSKAISHGFDVTSHEAKQFGSLPFDIIIESAVVVWVGGDTNSFLVLEDVEVNPNPPRPKGRPLLPPSLGKPLPTTAPVEPDTPEELFEEEEPQEEEATVAITARGAPMPDMDSWKAKLRG